MTSGAENSLMDPLMGELPVENEVVEKLKNSPSAHPGDIVKADGYNVGRGNDNN